MSTLPDIASAPLPIAYSRAREELAKCWRVDECKTWADKADALASYAKQADDKGLYEVALKIQARAIRRCGELLKELERPEQGGRPPNKPGGNRPVSIKQAAEDAGLTGHQRKQAIRVASVPEDEFEQEIESSNPPTVTKLAERGTKKEEPYYAKYGIEPADFHVATRLSGAILRFAELAESTDISQAVSGMMPGEPAKVCANAQISVAWLSRLIEVLQCTIPKS